MTRGSKSGSGGHPGDCVHVTRGKSSGEMGAHGECGRVTLGVGSGRQLPWKLENVTPGTGSGVSPRRPWTFDPGAFISKGYPLVCGCVTPGERSGSRDHPELW